MKMPVACYRPLMEPEPAGAAEPQDVGPERAAKLAAYAELAQDEERREAIRLSTLAAARAGIL
jgi:hypothetical protein